MGIFETTFVSTQFFHMKMQLAGVLPHDVNVHAVFFFLIGQHDYSNAGCTQNVRGRYI